jgi:transmembrane sensor
MKNEIEHNIPLDLIGRFLSGEASEKENDALNSWISESPANEKVFDEYRKVWEKTGILEGKPVFDLNYEWDYFQSHLTPPVNENEFWNFLAGPKFFGSFYRMAAVITIGLILGYSIYYLSSNSSTQTFYSQNGREKIELPDGSVVTLNKGAEITYPKSFASKTRLVNFTGEAFFLIQKDSVRPFIIRSNNLSIRVLGTSFNVKAIPGSPEIEVIVKTGKVAIYEGSDKINDKNIMAGERAVYNKELRKISIEENKNRNFLAWETGQIIFEESSLVEIINVLSSVYHKEFIIKSDNLKNCRVTVSFENQELYAVLKVLEATLDIHFTIKGEIIEISGQGC